MTPRARTPSAKTPSAKTSSAKTSSASTKPVIPKATATPERKSAEAPKLADGAGVTSRIAALVAERRDIRAHASPGSGISAQAENRMRAIDADIDRLWAELRRDRVPPQRAFARRSATPAARP
jgi:Protein of unknown function (DUF2630)